MNFRLTSLLFGVLIGCLFLFGLLVEYRKGVSDEGYLFPGIFDNSIIKIETVEITKDDQKYTLSLSNDEWVATVSGDKDEVLRLNGSKVKDLISEVRKVRKYTGADIPKSLKAADLKPPLQSVKLISANNSKTWTLNLGRSNESHVFVTTSEDKDTIYSVKTEDLSTTLFDSIDDLRPRSIWDLRSNNTQLLEVTKEGEKVLAVNKTKDNNWRFKTPDFGFVDFNGDSKSKEQVGLKKILDDLGSLRVVDFEPKESRSFRSFKLTEESANLVIKAKYVQGQAIYTQKLFIGRELKDKGQYYARLATDKFVSRISAGAIKTLQDTLGDLKRLRSRDLAFINLTSPDAVNIITGPKSAKEIKLRKSAPENWQMFVDGEKHKANPLAINTPKGLLDNLRGVNKIQQFHDKADD